MMDKLNIFCCDIHSEHRRNSGTVVSALRHFVEVFEQAVYPERGKKNKHPTKTIHFFPVKIKQGLILHFISIHLGKYSVPIPS